MCINQDKRAPSAAVSLCGAKHVPAACAVHRLYLAGGLHARQRVCSGEGGSACDSRL